MPQYTGVWREGFNQGGTCSKYRINRLTVTAVMIFFFKSSLSKNSHNAISLLNLNQFIKIPCEGLKGR